MTPHDAPRRVLLIGATGVFGSRLAGLLAGMPGLALVLAARRIDELLRLEAALLAQAPDARLSLRVVDRARPDDLAAMRPWLVIDAAGPFQDSGYDLAHAAVRAGAHYIDLADGRAFVAGFATAVGAAASTAGVLAVTGASSTPTLSHAALQRLVAGWQRIDDVVIAISPGARAPRGPSVMRAILGYVGQPVRVLRDGVWRDVRGWSGLRRVDMPHLGGRWASICETPDLDLLPRRFPIRRDALFMAGLEVAAMHLGLAALAWLVRWRLVANLGPLARPLRAIAGVLAALGSDRGGMIVDATGRDPAGRSIRARWALWADAVAGPTTPAAAAAALVRALLEGRETRRGAMAGAGVLDLDAILRELASLPIATRIDESHIHDPVLFRRLLGRRFADLPEPVRRVHDAAGPGAFAGRAAVRAGHSLPARVGTRLLGLPSSGLMPVRVELLPDSTGETWTRRFGDARFASRLCDTPRLGAFEERIGPLRFTFRLQITATGVVWAAAGWRFLVIPLPPRLAPTMRARADAVGGRYRFRVAVAHGLVGLLFAYRGWLEPVAAETSA